MNYDDSIWPREDLEVTQAIVHGQLKVAVYPVLALRASCLSVELNDLQRVHELTLVVSPSVDVKRTPVVLSEACCRRDSCLLDLDITEFSSLQVCETIDLNQVGGLPFFVATPDECYMFDRGHERVVLHE